MSNDGFKRHYAVGDSNPYLVTCATCGSEVAKQRPMVGEQGPELVDEIRGLREELVAIKREVRRRDRRAV